MKRCFTCGEEKPLSEFYKNKQKKDGHSIYCRTCDKKKVKEYVARNRERRLAYGAEYRNRNRDKAVAYRISRRPAEMDEKLAARRTQRDQRLACKADRAAARSEAKRLRGMGFRRCKTCDQLLPADAFRVRPDCAWRRLICKDCQSKRIADRRLEKPRLTPEQRHERSLERHRKMRTAVEYKRKQAEWRASNREIILEKKRQYAAENRERIRARNAEASRRYASTSKGQFARKAGKSQRRAVEFAAPGFHTAAELADLRASYLGLCGYCPAKAETFDHVVPLSRGGSNDIENLIPACYLCNKTKQGSSLLRWIAKGGARGRPLILEASP